MATNKPVDKNKDGIPDGDVLSMDQLQARYKFAYDVIQGDPELIALWKKATNARKGYWTTEAFTAALHDTDWYKNKSEPARLAWVAERTGGADWQTQLSDAENRVREAALEIGATPSDADIARLTRDYIYQGWGDPARARQLDQALSQYIGSPDGGFMRGNAGTLQEQMKALAMANGLTFSDGYYEAAAKSVGARLTTADDWMRQIREQAASLWPTWKDQILAGSDAADLASGYINTMAQTLEISPTSISLDDPSIRSAMTHTDDQGNPVALSLWDFQRSLMQDERYKGTQKFNNDLASIGTDILKRMGFSGA